ncbi:hypothetical protein KKC00_00445 [Patescibacteria group bacterium]|nr:hypothetical protein [Patescibacteria group bacterium]
MTNKNIKKDIKKIDLFVESREKGVAFLITFFVMGIALSVILGVSSILISEIKVIRNIGNSVSAFYAADTGIEEIIYFDSNKIPEGGTRGFCNICNVCSDFGCQDCQISGDDCDLDTCTDCQVSYYAQINGSRYDIISSVGPEEEVFRSYGSYAKTIRAIELNLVAGDDDAILQAPMIYNVAVVPRAVPEGIELEIVADIYDPDGVESARVHIQYPDENNVTPEEGIDFPIFAGVTYKTTWTGPVGFYYVDIEACDTKRHCSEKENI